MGGASERSAQYLGPYDERHDQAANMKYDAEWTPPEGIRSKDERKRSILGQCARMVKAMKQRNINLDKYHGNETEYTQAGFDIYLKMRVRLDKEAQYGVNMCWLCMPIRKGKTIWNTQDFRQSTKR
jgi:hypothetical protein